MNTLTDYEIENVYAGGASLRAVKHNKRWLVIVYPQSDKITAAFDLFQFLKWIEDNRGKLL